ncbi:MAG: sialate O-acetylesterase, partial [Flavisolibacter sp.]
RQGQKIILRFTPGQTLVQKGRNILGFEIAGNDQVFHDAIAKLAGNEIHVWHDMINEPVAVRYAFSNTAVGNVADQNGLPLAPFRTDNWKPDTSPVK